MPDPADREPKVVVERAGPVGTLIFSNPARLNAMSYAMWEAVPGCVADLVADPAIRLIVSRGEGSKAFVSGADISQFEERRGTDDAQAAYEAAVSAANRAIAECPKPTIAAVRGYCIGGGLGIALCCDLRVSDTTGRFAIPAAKLGLGYGYSGVKRLVDVVGPSFAKEIFYTARQFDATEALAMGLLNRVVEPDAFDALLADYADRIGGNAPLTMKAAKMAVDAAASGPAETDPGPVREAVAACFASQDYREGRTAFMEKRKPAFQGR